MHTSDKQPRAQVKREPAASGTLYWYMTPGVVAESDLAGTLKSEYVFFDGERVARRGTALPARAASSITSLTI